jgi:hypothetical protein
MMHFYISRNWLFSPTAQRVYLICTILDLALLATRMGVIAATISAGVFSFPPVTVFILRLLLFPEVIGTAILFVGMSYCWLGLGGSYKRKLLWLLFCGLFLIALPIYYFVSYRSLASKAEEQIPALANA